MYEAGTINATCVRRTVTFGNADATDDVDVSVPTFTLHGGSFEGHAVGSSATYNLPTKYGKMSVRCVY
jgi:hypothetical protein